MTDALPCHIFYRQDAKEAYGALSRKDRRAVRAAIGGMVSAGINGPTLGRMVASHEEDAITAAHFAVPFNRHSKAAVRVVFVGSRESGFIQSCEVMGFHDIPRSGSLPSDVPQSISAPAEVTTRLAAFVAGRRRTHLSDEWTAILAESGYTAIGRVSHRQLLLAIGFMIAALRMRQHDFSRPLWRPIDWTLSTSSRTNSAIAAVVGSQAIFIVGDDGLGALVTEVWEPCGIAGAALYALSRWLRRIRGIELAAAERQPADE